MPPVMKKQTWQIRGNHEIEDNREYDLHENAADGEDMNEEEEFPAETYHGTINNEDIYSLHMEACCFDMCLPLIKMTMYFINA